MPDWADEEAERLIREALDVAEACRPSAYADWRECEISALAKPVAAALRRARAAGLREGAEQARHLAVNGTDALLWDGGVDWRGTLLNLAAALERRAGGAEG